MIEPSGPLMVTFTLRTRELQPGSCPGAEVEDVTYFPLTLSVPYTVTPSATHLLHAKASALLVPASKMADAAATEPIPSRRNFFILFPHSDATKCGCAI